jgi:hypothetical protein
MDDVSTSVAGQEPTTQCGEAANTARQLERMKPIMGALAWIPIGSDHPPPAFDDHLVFWNPCDGCDFGYWDDINHNWRLYSAGYKPPQEIRWEKADRLEESTGCTGVEALKALSAANGDEQLALAALKAGGAK